MTKLRKLNYWERITEYYYENIWDAGQTDNLYDWANDEYNMKASRYSEWMEFSNESDATWFVMKWA